MAVSCQEACKHTAEQGQNSMGFSGAGGPNGKMFDMDRLKIGMNNPLNKDKVGNGLQDIR